ncbi:alpha-N-methyltransferase NTM1 [Dichotomocladium elegans]|nr:alpha-N-methyltransferase NTM1 [Dichotomocladium elegans]
MDQPDWYANAQKYWTNVSPTVNGMLGGFAVVDPIDARGSLHFVKPFFDANNTTYACDCGAGIGRVTKNFLLQVPFAKVDLVEQAPNFVAQAKESYLKAEIDAGRIGDIQCKGLQEFSPESNKYDLIWCQWVLGHLTDDDLIAFFKRCKAGLRPGGLIGVKENNSSKDYLVDEEDSSVTRPNDALKKIFASSGLELIKEDVQHGLPAGLFTVRM